MLTAYSLSATGHNSIRVELVTSMDQLIHVFAIRAICYVEDKHTVLPFNHAFDGNDLQSTHMVAYLGDEPIGALRIRWFSDFAKIERTGFRPSYRNPRYLQAAAPGLSPHMRGNPVICGVANPNIGSIPAHAGEPKRSGRTRRRSKVYPRTCGGTIIAVVPHYVSWLLML
jgi:hypothetical protein